MADTLTKVLFDFRRPAVGGLVPAGAGSLGLALMKRATRDGFIVVKSSYDVDVVDGLAEVDMLPTAADEYWRVTERISERFVRNVVVPQRTEPVLYTDLLDVDPQTLEPTAEAVAGWTAQMAEFRAIRDDIMQAATLLTIARGGN